MPANLTLVRANLPRFLAEGHLYRAGDRYYLVFTGASRRGWDVCVTTADGADFGPVLFRNAPTRDEALQRLSDAVEQRAA